jgi:hypothetical protein
LNSGKLQLDAGGWWGESGAGLSSPAKRAIGLDMKLVRSSGSQYNIGLWQMLFKEMNKPLQSLLSLLCLVYGLPEARQAHAAP